MQMHALVPLASKEEIGMSAFVIVESTVRDREPLGRYTAQAEPILRRSGGQTLVCGSLRTLSGKPVFDRWYDLLFSEHGCCISLV